MFDGSNYSNLREKAFSAIYKLMLKDLSQCTASCPHWWASPWLVWRHAFFLLVADARRSAFASWRREECTATTMTTTITQTAPAETTPTMTSHPHHRHPWRKRADCRHFRLWMRYRDPMTFHSTLWRQRRACTCPSHHHLPCTTCTPLRRLDFRLQEAPRPCRPSTCTAVRLGRACILFTRTLQHRGRAEVLPTRVPPWQSRPLPPPPPPSSRNRKAPRQTVS